MRKAFWPILLLHSITAIETESGVLVCDKYAIWPVLFSTYHFLPDDSLQSAHKDQQKSCVVARKPHDVVVNFDTIEIYSGIARLSLQKHGFLVPQPIIHVKSILLGICIFGLALELLLWVSSTNSNWHWHWLVLTSTVGAYTKIFR